MKPGIMESWNIGVFAEVAFTPEQIAKRLHDYIQQENLSPGDRILPICYSTARPLFSMEDR